VRGTFGNAGRVTRGTIVKRRNTEGSPSHTRVI
jgi:hypothetical protein